MPVSESTSCFLHRVPGFETTPGAATPDCTHVSRMPWRGVLDVRPCRRLLGFVAGSRTLPGGASSPARPGRPVLALIGGWPSSGASARRDLAPTPSARQDATGPAEIG